MRQPQTPCLFFLPENADPDIPILKQAKAEYAGYNNALSTHHKEPNKFGNTSPALPK